MEEIGIRPKVEVSLATKDHGSGHMLSNVAWIL